MGLKTLSPFPYYGGKAKMAKLICDMLDYKDTDIYIEPFGGAARVLLNKPSHKVEIYNDSSDGLCAFMRVMSNKDTANKLISRLYETEYNIEEFYRAMIIRNEVEDHFIDELRRRALLYLKHLISKYESVDLQLLRESIKYKKVSEIDSNYEEVVKSNLLYDKELVILEEIKNLYNNYMEIYKKIYLRVYKEQYRLNFKAFKEEAMEGLSKYLTLEKNIGDFKEIMSSIDSMKFIELKKSTQKKLRKMSHRKACEIAYIETSNNHDTVEYDDIDLAVATYIIYSQSRDGMGKDFSPNKYKSTEQYYSQINRLYDVAERLEGVYVSQVGALSYLLECSYLNDKRAMFYLDPSYLKEDDEEKNLGTLYKDSFTYEDHETFLKAICNAKCKILISNYDTNLYNKYLNKRNGWSCIEFNTTTGVGGKKDNKRVEVLWYNY